MNSGEVLPVRSNQSSVAAVPVNVLLGVKSVLDVTERVPIDAMRAVSCLFV